MTIIYLEDWLLYDPINQTLHLVECGRGSRYLIEKMQGLTYEEQTKLTDKIRKKYEKGMSESLLQKWNHIVEVAIHYRPDVVAKMKFLKYEYGCLTMINKFWMDRRTQIKNCVGKIRFFRVCSNKWHTSIGSYKGISAPHETI